MGYNTHTKIIDVATGRATWVKTATLIGTPLAPPPTKETKE